MTAEKTNIEKIVTWLSLFVTTLVVPLGILTSDMTFDLILVVAYGAWLYKDDDSESPSKLPVCYSMKNATNETDSYTNIDDLNKLNTDIPSQLTGKPRFWYALAFIVFPWIFYGIEFFHSRHFTWTVRKVR